MPGEKIRPFRGCRKGEKIRPWLLERVRDIPWRAKADRLLRECVAANLKARDRPWWVRAHVPWCVWFFVRIGGWWHWGRDGQGKRNFESFLR